MRFFLVGMPGSGKSTAAKKFAELKNIDFFDTDILIEKKYNTIISDIFKIQGENIFRIYEREILNDLLEQDNFIAATGGGLPYFFDNSEKMNDAGITVYLKTNIEVLFQRINDSESRPLIAGKTEKELKKYLSNMLKKRKTFYEKAEYIVDANRSIYEILKSEPFNLKNVFGI
ncbi:MAG: AAA family ATPase [Bacteroidales bacterium]|nr:AAA family ATPase [Bacteroidales bacterium]